MREENREKKEEIREKGGEKGDEIMGGVRRERMLEMD